MDIDHFHESERYALAESIPLSLNNFNVVRASFAMRASTLSLVRTFPRIINGYDLTGRLLIVVPMSEVSSARLNGESVGRSLIFVKGATSCTVHEPESRLVAILSIRSETLGRKWQDFVAGSFLLKLPPERLSGLQGLIRDVLEFAATNPEVIADANAMDQMQEAVFAAFDEATSAGDFHCAANSKSLSRYKTIIDKVDELVDLHPAVLASTELATTIGVSVRTLHSASQSICGLSSHRYSRLRRLWLVRRQLRTGAAGMTVRATALARGFQHMSEFSRTYRDAFGEVPSETLGRARNPESRRRL